MKGTVTLRKRGQITIPKEMIQALNLKEGDLLVVDVNKAKE